MGLDQAEQQKASAGDQALSTAPMPVPSRHRLISHESVLAVMLILIMAVLSMLNDRFFTAGNLLNITRFFAEIGLIALPMTLIIISGGIDLSVGSIFGWSGVMLGIAWQSWGWPLPLAILVCLGTGTLAGLVNGFLVSRIKIPPLIVTLATLAIFRGMALGMSQGAPVSGYPDWFTFLGQGNIGPLPTQFVLLVLLTVAVLVFLARSAWGRYLYAIGNNARGARFSGLPVDQITVTLYTFSGFMAALAAFIYVSRVTTTRADAGTALELDVIAAVVLGGTSIYGGAGSIMGTVLGFLTIALLRNGLTLAGVRGEATVVVIGAVLILAVFINRLLRGTKGDVR